MILSVQQLILITLILTFRASASDFENYGNIEETTSLYEPSSSVASSGFELSVTTNPSNFGLSEDSAEELLNESPSELSDARNEPELKIDKSTAADNESLNLSPSVLTPSEAVLSENEEPNRNLGLTEDSHSDQPDLPENSREPLHEEAAEKIEEREDEKSVKEEKEKNNAPDETDDSDLKTTKENTKLDAVSDLSKVTDQDNRLSFDDTDTENVSSPVSPIVDFFNDSYLSDFVEKTKQSEDQVPEILSSSETLYRIFMGPDRSKLASDSTPQSVYQYLANIFENETLQMSQEVVAYIMQVGRKVALDSKCSNALTALYSGLKARRTWASNFLDLKGQIHGEDLRQGRVFAMGNFDQCLATRVQDESLFLEEPFSGRYCLASVKPLVLPLEKKVQNSPGSLALPYSSNSFVLGLCVPSPCSSHDVSNIMNQVLSPYNLTVSFESRCSSGGKFYEGPSPPKYAIFFLGLVILMAILGTVYEAYNRKGQENCVQRIFISFSIISNTKRLLGQTNFSAAEEKIACEKRSISWIHGLQVIALFWLIVANVYQLGGLPISFIIKNLHQDFGIPSSSLLFQFVLNSWDYLAEFFFLISGFVFASAYLSIHEKKKAPSFGRFLVKNWLRFAPSIIALIFTTLIIFQTSWSSGPLYSKAEHLIVNQCNENGITNIMLLSNWLPTKDMCLPHTWYLSALFQLQIVAFFVVILLHRNSTIGITICLILILLGIVLPGMVTYIDDLPPTFVFSYPNIGEIRKNLQLQYFATYNHLSSYFIGVLSGYYIQKKGVKLTMHKGIRFAIWIILGTISLSSILITRKWNGFKQVPDSVTSSLFSALHRIAFVSVFTWLIHQFTVLQKGSVDKFLSWNGFKVINRLGMQIYLIHVVIIWHYFLTKRTVVEYRNFEMITVSFGIAFFSALVGYLFYVIVEAPFHQMGTSLVKYLFGCKFMARLKELKVKSKSSSKKTTGNETEEKINEEAESTGANPTEVEKSVNINEFVIQL